MVIDALLGSAAQKLAHLEVYEPEATIVRRLFRDYVTEQSVDACRSTWQLNQDSVPFPEWQGHWGVSTIGRLLRNEAYVGRVYYTELPLFWICSSHQRERARSRAVPVSSGLPSPVPAIVSEELFEAAATGQP